MDDGCRMNPHVNLLGDGRVWSTLQSLFFFGFGSWMCLQMRGPVAVPPNFGFILLQSSAVLVCFLFSWVLPWFHQDKALSLKKKPGTKLWDRCVCVLVPWWRVGDMHLFCCCASAVVNSEMCTCSSCVVLRVKVEDFQECGCIFKWWRVTSSSPVYCVSPLMPEKRSLSSQYLYCPLDISNEEGKLVLRV